MRRTFQSLIFILCACYLSYSQKSDIDSLRLLIDRSPGDSSKVKLMIALARTYVNTLSDSCIYIATQAKIFSEKINYPSGKALALKYIGMGYYIQAKYVLALDYWRQSLSEFEAVGDNEG